MSALTMPPGFSAALPADFSPQDTALPSDGVLMQRIAGGDQAAFALLMRRYWPWLCRRAHGRIGANEAEDIAQETLLRAWCAAGRYDPAKAGGAVPGARGWLDRIAHNLAIDHARRAGPALQTLDPEMAAGGADAFAQFSARETAARLRRGIATLPAGQRAALQGSAKAGQGSAKAGQGSAKAGQSGRAQEGRLYRARTALRVLLTEG